MASGKLVMTTAATKGSDSNRIDSAEASAIYVEDRFPVGDVIVTSGALTLSIDNELIHWTILFLAIPVSIYALITGVSNHNDYAVFLVGLAGLGTLFVTALSESFLTETSVIIFTLMGSALVVYAHLKNFQLCKELDCDCHDVV